MTVQNNVYVYLKHILNIINLTFSCISLRPQVKVFYLNIFKLLYFIHVKRS